MKRAEGLMGSSRLQSLMTSLMTESGPHRCGNSRTREFARTGLINQNAKLGLLQYSPTLVRQQKPRENKLGPLFCGLQTRQWWLVPASTCLN